MTNRQSELKLTGERHLLRVYPYTLDLIIDRGEGSYLIDTEGREYLDFATGIGVNILGHRNQRVLSAITAQLEKVIHTGNLYVNEPQISLADQLCKMTGLDRVFFCNSGVEANETAFKAARAFGNSKSPKRSEILCFDHGWHGRTIAAISATGSGDMQAGFEPLVPGFKVVKTFDLKEIEAAISAQTIALIFEPILGHGGILPAPRGFLRDARELCDQHGLLMILDEIQTGLGRTGNLFRCQSEGVVPDILTVAKGLAGGLPIGAALMKQNVAQVLGIGSHGTTFGGNPVAASAALEVLSQVSDQGFLEQVKVRGAQFLEGLRALQKLHPSVILDARGVGLMSALIISGDRNEFARKLASNGVLCTTLKPNCIRFLPPLNISENEVREALAAIESTLSV